MRRGLTLIELIITISLAVIVGIPFGVLLTRHLEGAIRVRDATVAMSLARRELELLDSFDDFCHAALTIPGPPPFASYQGTVYTLRRTVACEAQSGGNCTTACSATPTGSEDHAVKRITVTVTRNGSPDELARLVTFRAKYVRFGQ